MTDRLRAALPPLIRLNVEAGRRLGRPGALAALLCGCLLTFACGLTPRLGFWAVAYKHYVPYWLLLAIWVALAHRALASCQSARRAVAANVWAAIPLAIGLFLVMGGHHLVSNGGNYADMATDWWDADATNSTSRRIGLPALAHVIGFDRDIYPVFWFAVLFAAVCFADAFLRGANLLLVERTSILTSSIFAYALIAPGYGEVFVFLLGFYCLRVRPALPERIVTAALMVATHETATIFVALVVLVESDDTERAEWLLILAALYAAYVGAFVLNWNVDLLQALSTTGKPNPYEAASTLDWLFAYPWRAGLGIFIAYKLYWIPLLAGLGRRYEANRALTIAALASLVLVAIGTDVSRLVQFGSLAMMASLPAVLQTWGATTRRALAWANLAIPSLYIAVNADPLWGNGLYAHYLRAAQRAGVPWVGRVFNF